MNTSITLEKYMEEIASSAPTPGGGNVAAVSGALACSLGVMVCNLSIGKKKYANVEEEMKILKEQIEISRLTFLELSRKDNEAFDAVMDAFKLPKETEEEKAARNIKIEETTIMAGQIPALVVNLSKDTASYIKEAGLKGNVNALSDAGVALSLLQTAAKGAYFNVMINCSPLKNNLMAKELLSKSFSDYNETAETCKTGLDEIEKRLGQ